MMCGLLCLSTLCVVGAVCVGGWGSVWVCRVSVCVLCAVCVSMCELCVCVPRGCVCVPRGCVRVPCVCAVCVCTVCVWVCVHVCAMCVCVCSGRWSHFPAWILSKVTGVRVSVLNWIGKLLLNSSTTAKPSSMMVSPPSTHGSFLQQQERAELPVIQARSCRLCTVIAMLEPRGSSN